MSQVDLGLAALEGVDERQAGARISKYELGVHKPKFETIEQFAKALGIPAGYFFTQSEEMSQAILLLAELPAHKQREAVALLRKMVEANKPK